MAAGTALRNAARTVINQVGNTVTLTEQTESFNEFNDVTYSEGSASNIIAATTANIVPKFLKQVTGDVEHGDIVVYVKDSDTINKTDKVTFNGSAYQIDEMKPIYVENILVVTVATCYLDRR